MTAAGEAGAESLANVRAWPINSEAAVVTLREAARIAECWAEDGVRFMVQHAITATNTPEGERPGRSLGEAWDEYLATLAVLDAYFAFASFYGWPPLVTAGGRSTALALDLLADAIEAFP